MIAQWPQVKQADTQGGIDVPQIPPRLYNIINPVAVKFIFHFGFISPSQIMAEPNRQQEDPLVCRVCNQAYTSKSRLFEHLREAHDIGRKLYDCTTCSYTTYRAGNLQRHIRLVHNKRNKRHRHHGSRRHSRSHSRSRHHS